MHKKAIVFQDTSLASKIIETKKISKIKTMGYPASFNNNEWDKHKTQIVTNGIYLKFTKSEVKIEGRTLRELLVGTGDRELVYAATWDKYWGIGYSRPTAERNRESWGENALGKILMAVRTRIRDEDAAMQE